MLKFSVAPGSAGFAVTDSTGLPTAQGRAIPWCEALLPDHDDELPGRHPGKPAALHAHALFAYFFTCFKDAGSATRIKRASAAIDIPYDASTSSARATGHRNYPSDTA